MSYNRRGKGKSAPQRDRKLLFYVKKRKREKIIKSLAVLFLAAVIAAGFYALLRQ